YDPRDVRGAEGTDQPALGRPAARQEGLRSARTRRRHRRRSRGAGRSGGGVSEMAKIRIIQTGSPIRRDKTQRATLVGLGLNKLHRSIEVEGTPEVLGQAVRCSTC